MMMNNLATDEFPYQIVAFMGCEPELGARVYSGKSGWLPQIGIKRRFGLQSIGEAELLGRLTSFLATIDPFSIQFGATNRSLLPVEVIEVQTEAPKLLHYALLGCLGRKITSRYPDREGDGYFPHLTIEWNGHYVVDPNKFVSQHCQVENLWLLKDDVTADDTRVHARFPLGTGF